MKTSLFQSTILALCVASLVGLSGCATFKQENRIDKQATNIAFERQEAISNPVSSSRTFVVNDGFYAAKKPLAVVPVNAKGKLPESFFKSASMDDQRPISLSEIVSRITTNLGYVVSIDQDVLSMKSTSSAPQGLSPTPVTLPPLPEGEQNTAPTSLPPLPGANLNPDSDPLVLKEFIYSGNLVGLLDTLTGRLGLSWRWTGHEVQIFRFETRMFRLDAIAGDITNSAKLNTTSSTGSAGGGGGGSGGSGGAQSGAKSGAKSTGSTGQNTTVNYDMKIWKDVEDSLKGVASADGTIIPSPSAGLITVRDTPAVLDQMEAMVSEFNRLYTRQAVLKVEIYSIERSSSQQYAIDWNLVYQKATKYGYSLSSLSGAGTGAQSFRFNKTSGPWAGSDVMLNALSTAGRASLVNSYSVVAMNGQTVPVNVSREQTYLAETSTTFNGTDGSGNTVATTTLTPGIVSDGISMNFTPRLLENNGVLLRYAIDLSTTESITNYVAPDGQSSIQLPRRSVRNFLQNVSLQSGETLVLTGFQQLQGDSSGQGPGSPKAWILGGSKSANTLSRTLVIVVTPYVTDR